MKPRRTLVSFAASAAIWFSLGLAAPAQGSPATSDAAALDGSVMVQVEGTIAIYLASAVDPTGPDTERVYVMTDDGLQLPVEDGDGLVAGAEVTAQAVVQAGVAEALPPAAQTELAEAVGEAADGVVAAEVPAAAALLELAVEDEAVTVSQITVQAMPTFPPTTATALNHTFDVVVNYYRSGTPAPNAYLSDEWVRSLLSEAQTYYQRETGKAVTFTINGQIRHMMSSASCSDAYGIWDAASTLIGMYGQSYIELDQRHLLVIDPHDHCDQTFGGIATQGYKGMQGGGYIIVGSHEGDETGFSAPEWPYDHGINRSTMVHELGHNLGLEHSNLLRCAAAAGQASGSWDMTTAGTCTVDEYWDEWEMMGTYNAYSHIGATRLYQWGLLSPSEYQLVSGTQSEQTYTLTAVPYTSSSGLKAIIITDPAGGPDLVVEHRQGDTRVIGTTATNGIRLVLPQSDYSTQLIQPTGGMLSYSDPDFQRLALPPGQTYVSTSGIRVRTISANATTAVVAISIGQDGDDATVSFSGGATWQPPANTSGGSLTLTGTVTTNQGTWTATSSAPWLTVSLNSGTSGASLTLTAAANTSTEARSGYVTLTAGSATYRVDVTQAAASVAASVSFSGGSTWFAPTNALGGSLSIKGTVTTNQGTWGAISSVAWLAVSPASGATGETLTITAQPNTTLWARVGSVTIKAGSATLVVAVTQYGEPAPAFSFSGGSAWSAPANASGGSLTLTGTVASPSAWTAVSSVPWLTLSPATGASGGSLTLAVTENTTGVERWGYVTLTAGPAVYQIDVTQAGASAVATLTFSGGSTWNPPANASLGALTLTGTVTTNQASYTVARSVAWLTISRTSGTNGTELTITAAANTSTEARTGLVLMAAGTATFRITVTQAGAPPPATLSFSGGATWSPPATTSDGGALTLTGVVTTNQPVWTAASSVAWLTVSPATGTSGAALTMAVTENTAGEVRSGYVTLTAGSATYRLTVTQSGAPAAATLSFSGGATWYPPATTSDAAVFKLTGVVTTNQASWTAAKTGTWLTLSRTTGTSGLELTITTLANTSQSARVGYVTLSAGSATYRITVTQAGIASTPTLSYTPSVGVGTYSSSTWYAPASASGTIYRSGVVTTNQVTWTATRSVAWLGVSPASGGPGATLTIVAQPNTTNAARAGYVIIRAGTASVVVTVYQYAAPVPAVSFSPAYGNGAYSNSAWYAPANPVYGTTIYLAGPVTTNQSAWVASRSAAWLTVSPATGASGATLTINAQPNTTGQARAGYITIRAGTASQVVVVYQYAAY